MPDSKFNVKGSASNGGVNCSVDFQQVVWENAVPPIRECAFTRREPKEKRGLRAPLPFSRRWIAFERCDPAFNATP